MRTATKDRPSLKRRNEDFFSRRNRMSAKLILKQQKEENEKRRDRDLEDTSLDRILRAE